MNKCGHEKKNWLVWERGKFSRVWLNNEVYIVFLLDKNELVSYQSKVLTSLFTEYNWAGMGNKKQLNNVVN